MMDIDKELSVIKRFLLHRMEEDERQRLEERFLTDAEFRESVLIIEEELIDDYLAGLLATDEREDFVRHYLAGPRQREEFKLSQALREHAIEDVEEASPTGAANADSKRGQFRFFNLFLGMEWLTALKFALVLVVAVAVLWALASRWRWGNQQAALSAEVAMLNRQPSSQEPTMAVRLTGALSRAPEQAQRLTVPGNVSVVQLLLNLPRQQYRNYEATLRISDGPEAFTVSDLPAAETAEGRFLKLRIPARVLTPEDYILSVKGKNADGRTEELADYFFRVVKSEK